MLSFSMAFSKENNVSSALIGTYSDANGIQNNFTLGEINEAVNNYVSENPEIGFTGSLVEALISDSLPTHDSSVAYLILRFVNTENVNTSLGIKLNKITNEDGSINYYLDTTYLENSSDEVAARKWTCTTVQDCHGCKPIRTGFLGLGGVVVCKCPGFDVYCHFVKSGGSDFPWTLIGTLATILVTILHE